MDADTLGAPCYDWDVDEWEAVTKLRDTSDSQLLLPDHGSDSIAPGQLEKIDVLPKLTDDVAAQPETTCVNSPSIFLRTRPSFSQSSVRVLRRWLAANSHHPYPSKETKEMLSGVTGLNETQVSNWFTNARRRSRAGAPRVASFTSFARTQEPESTAAAMEIPKRGGTPGIFEGLCPLQRWANSPPEDEAASPEAIFGALHAASSTSSPKLGAYAFHLGRNSDDQSSTSASIQSSMSRRDALSSDGSFGSAHSSQYGTSPSQLAALPPKPRRRRHKRTPKYKGSLKPGQQSLRPFQCTFCTEDFNTKHDWQRHEKTWHLSLDRWVCTPTGPLSVERGSGTLICVFCGEREPDTAHVESHNFTLCKRRRWNDRTFYRKDHLAQHLRLVHRAKVSGPALESWKAEAPPIRSRCGFCDTTLDSWAARVEHLANHFKLGITMESWVGDWGFEDSVLKTVENALPPYLVHQERRSPLPYMASGAVPWTPICAYQILKMELQYWIMNRVEDVNHPPSDAEIQHEACRVIFSADVLSKRPTADASSWVRDLVMSSKEITQDAMFRTVRGQAENLMTSLRINGKDSVFENCRLERQLREYYSNELLNQRQVTDSDLQFEADRILRRTEHEFDLPSDEFSNWFLRLVYNSTEWLEDFKQRALSAEAQNTTTDDVTLLLEGSNMELFTQDGDEMLEKYLTNLPQEFGQEPNTHSNQTATRRECDGQLNRALERETASKITAMDFTTGGSTAASSASPVPFEMNSRPVSRSGLRKANPPHLLNDANAYRRLARGLARFVAATTSNHNPNKHVPSDKEIQHHARCLEFDDDDPWNQTEADNPEWLARFKREVGILPPETGPGLGM